MKKLSFPSFQRWQPLDWLRLVTILSAIALFVCSSVRHLLFQSTAFDLGYFDQATYLMSVGKPPIVSFWGFHFLGGHADWIMYAVALLYKLVPSVYWLLGIQAIALALGAIPSYFLGIQAGLKEQQALAIAIAYILYPLIFNLNLFDFHPEVIALPLVLLAVWIARRGQSLREIGGFTLSLIVIFGCRDALSLTIVAMGLWLLIWEKKHILGTIAIVLGSAWFLIATQWLIPQFRPGGVESVTRFAHLGDSVGEIALNLFLKPQVVLATVFTPPNLWYLCLLLMPILWGLSIRHLAPLVPTIPTLAMNVLSTMESQKDLLHQYSLPAVPFLLLAAIAALSHGRGLVQKPRWIIVWSLVGFISLAKIGYFGDRYLTSLPTWQATRTAISQVPSQAAILTTAWIAPHVTHRPMVKIAISGTESSDLNEFDAVLVDVNRPGWMSTPDVLKALINRVQSNSQFKLQFHQDSVYLFIKPSDRRSITSP
jgi:uncharacterized membrane protein